MGSFPGEMWVPQLEVEYLRLSIEASIMLAIIPPEAPIKSALKACLSHPYKLAPHLEHYWNELMDIS